MEEKKMIIDGWTWHVTMIIPSRLQVQPPPRSYGNASNSESSIWTQRTYFWVFKSSYWFGIMKDDVFNAYAQSSLRFVTSAWSATALICAHLLLLLRRGMSYSLKRVQFCCRHVHERWASFNSSQICLSEPNYSWQPYAYLALLIAFFGSVNVLGHYLTYENTFFFKSTPSPHALRVVTELDKYLYYCSLSYLIRPSRQPIDSDEWLQCVLLYTFPFNDINGNWMGHGVRYEFLIFDAMSDSKMVLPGRRIIQKSLTKII